MATHGPNRLAEVQPLSTLERLLRQFHNLLLYLLMAASVVTALMGHWVDTAVIAAVVIHNAVIGFVQEGKAEKALQAIRYLLAPHAVVLRDGRQHEIAAADLVPGDSLADDNFASIAHGVEEGRTVYDNLKKTVIFLMPISPARLWQWMQPGA